MLVLINFLNIMCCLIIWTFIIGGYILIFIIPAIKELHHRMMNPIPIELKIYLDDERKSPLGWVQVYDYQGCIDMLRFNPSHLSLDHDLGEDKTGYDIIKWIEEKTFTDPNYNPPIITVHSANPAGRQNIERAIDSIKRIKLNRK